MEFTLTDEQRMLVEGIAGIVRRYGGPERSRLIAAGAPHDDDLLVELANHGYLDVATDAAAGPLEAVLIVDAVTTGLGTCSVGASAVVAPLSGCPRVPSSGPLVLATRAQIDAGVPVRFGATDANVIVLGHDGVAIHPIRLSEPVERSWGYPLATIRPGSVALELDEAAPRVAAWWRVSLSAELVACAAASLELTVAYTRQRQQFGRPLASFRPCNTGWRSSLSPSRALAGSHTTPRGTVRPLSGPCIAPCRPSVPAAKPFENVTNCAERRG